MPGVNWIAWAFHIDVDRTHRDVTVSLLGLGRSHAVYRDGFGCTLDHGTVAVLSLPPDDHKPALLPEIAGPALVEATTPELQAALDRAFFEPACADLSPHQGGGGGEGRSCRRRALCKRLRHRHADTRLLRDQIGDLGPDGHSGASGQADARWSGAGCGVAKCRTIPAMRSRSINCCAIPRALRSAVRCRLRSASTLEPVNRMKYGEVRHGGLCRKHAA